MQHTLACNLRISDQNASATNFEKIEYTYQTSVYSILKQKHKLQLISIIYYMIEPANY